MNTPQCSLVLPCRNEATHLTAVLAAAPKIVTEIIIVDNNSTDNTAQVCAKLAKQDSRIRYLLDPRQKDGVGYGFAIMTGLVAARGDFVIVADGDGSYPFGEILSAVEFMEKQRLDFVSCSRYPVGSGAEPIPIKLWAGVRILNTWVKLLYGLKFDDILSGMMIIRRASLNKLRLDAGDWNMSPQLKLEAFRHLRASEFHISQQQRFGKTKQHYVKTGISHMFWILANRFQ
ncbi:glycosyltransferase family 2 protein [Candidatus Saccharibacteria bacterium]|nr:glycosyltransferase family 2 protein [Candidatus Saccharibacteria bacterium]